MEARQEGTDSQPQSVSSRPTPSPILGTHCSATRTELEGDLSRASEFAFSWIQNEHGSAVEFVAAMERSFGTKIRMHLLELVRELASVEDLTKALREYLNVTLGEEVLREALGATPKPDEEKLSSLDELFSRSRILRSTEKFAEAIEFVSRFRDYSPYNNMLVYVQNPEAAYWATASHWRKAFGRQVKDDAKPMVILAPMTPVLLVYDLADTEGPPLPEWFIEPFATEGPFNESALATTIENCGRDRIQVEYKKYGQLHAGSAMHVPTGSDMKVRIELNEELDPRGQYSTLCHELAHVYLGHLGSDRDKWWPSRLNLRRNQREIEAEAVGYIVCRRAGLTTRSAEYLAGYIRSVDELARISIDLIMKVAGLIERMGKAKLPPRKTREKSSGKP